MIRIFILSFIFILCSNVLIYPHSSEGLINWHDNLEEALGEAQFLDIPVMINISTDFNELDKNIFSKKKFIESTRGFVSLKLNGNSAEEISIISKRYGITNNQYTIYIDPNTMDVLDRLEGNYFSQSGFLSSMQKAIDTKPIVDIIKTTDKPTIEGLDFFINQNNADKSYRILLDAVINGNKIYSIHKNYALETLNDKSKVQYFNKIADIYLNQYKDFRNALNVYRSLIRYCASEREAVMYADTKIIEIYRSRNDTDGLINHINQILSRPNTPIKYKEYYLDIVIEIENQDDM